MWSKYKKAILLAIAAAVMVTLGALLTVDLLIPYLDAKNSMDPNACLAIRTNEDDTLRVEWPEGENANGYNLQVLGRDGTLLYSDFTTQCVALLPQLPGEQELKVRITSVHDYDGKSREGSGSLEATVQVPSPQIRDLNWRSDAALGTVDVDFDMSEGNLCRVYMGVGDEAPVLVEELREGKLHLQFGEGEKYEIPTYDAPLHFTFQLERSSQNVLYQGCATEGFTLTREFLLGSDLNVEHTYNGDNSYTLTWNETRGAYYDVRVSEDGGKTWMTLAYIPADRERTFTTPSLKACTDYTISVVAVGGQTVPEGTFAAEAEAIKLHTDEKLLYSTIWPLMELTVYQNPQARQKLGTVAAGSAWCVLGQEGKFFKIRFQDQDGYINGDYCMINVAEYLGNLCAYDITNSYSSIYLVHEYGIAGVSGTVITGYEDVRVGQKEYLVPLLYPTAQKLLKAGRAAKELGCRLKIYDSFRPQDATHSIYQLTFDVMRRPVPDRTFSGKAVSDLNLIRGNPYQRVTVEQENEDGTTKRTDITAMTFHTLMTNNGEYDLALFLAPNTSRHNYGVALDLTLTDAEGKELAMQSAMHDLSWYSASKRNNDNAALLYKIMTEAGMRNIYSEWWHFQDNEAFEKHAYEPLKSGVSWECWVADHNGWRYRRADGSFFANCTQIIDGQGYTFDENGYIGTG